MKTPKNLIQILQNFAQSQTVEPGVILFRVEGLQCQVYSNPDHMQSLHVKITQAMMGPQDMKPQYQWNHDDLQTLETYFEQRAASPPYRHSSLCVFIRFFVIPPHVLKDIIQILRLDLRPEQCQSMGLHYTVQLSLRASFSVLPIIPLGAPAMVNTKNKLLFFVSDFLIP